MCGEVQMEGENFVQCWPRLLATVVVWCCCCHHCPSSARRKEVASGTCWMSQIGGAKYSMWFKSPGFYVGAVSVINASGHFLTDEIVRWHWGRWNPADTSPCDIVFNIKEIAERNQAHEFFLALPYKRTYSSHLMYYFQLLLFVLTAPVHTELCWLMQTHRLCSAEVPSVSLLLWCSCHYHYVPTVVSAQCSDLSAVTRWQGAEWSRHSLSGMSCPPGSPTALQSRTVVTNGLQSRTVTVELQSRTVTIGLQWMTVTIGLQSKTVTTGLQSRSATIGLQSRMVTIELQSRSVTTGLQSRTVTMDATVALSLGTWLLLYWDRGAITIGSDKFCHYD